MSRLLAPTASSRSRAGGEAASPRGAPSSPSSTGRGSSVRGNSSSASRVSTGPKSAAKAKAKAGSNRTTAKAKAAPALQDQAQRRSSVIQEDDALATQLSQAPNRRSSWLELAPSQETEASASPTKKSTSSAASTANEETSDEHYTPSFAGQSAPPTPASGPDDEELLLSDVRRHSEVRTATSNRRSKAEGASAFFSDHDDNTEHEQDDESEEPSPRRPQNSAPSGAARRNTILSSDEETDPSPAKATPKFEEVVEIIMSEKAILKKQKSSGAEERKVSTRSAARSSFFGSSDESDSDEEENQFVPAPSNDRRDTSSSIQALADSRKLSSTALADSQKLSSTAPESRQSLVAVAKLNLPEKEDQIYEKSEALDTAKNELPEVRLPETQKRPEDVSDDILGRLGEAKLTKSMSINIKAIGDSSTTSADATTAGSVSLATFSPRSSPGGMRPWGDDDLQTASVLRRQLEELEEQQRQIQVGLTQAIEFERRLRVDELARCQAASAELAEALARERQRHEEDAQARELRLDEQLKAYEARWRQEVEAMQEELNVLRGLRSEKSHVEPAGPLAKEAEILADPDRSSKRYSAPANVTPEARQVSFKRATSGSPLPPSSKEREEIAHYVASRIAAIAADLTAQACNGSLDTSRELSSIEEQRQPRDSPSKRASDLGAPSAAIRRASQGISGSRAEDSAVHVAVSAVELLTEEALKDEDPEVGSKLPPVTSGSNAARLSQVSEVSRTTDPGPEAAIDGATSHQGYIAAFEDEATRAGSKLIASPKEVRFVKNGKDAFGSGFADQSLSSETMQELSPQPYLATTSLNSVQAAKLILPLASLQAQEVRSTSPCASGHFIQEQLVHQNPGMAYRHPAGFQVLPPPQGAFGLPSFHPAGSGCPSPIGSTSTFTASPTPLLRRQAAALAAAPLGTERFNPNGVPGPCFTGSHTPPVWPGGVPSPNGQIGRAPWAWPSDQGHQMAHSHSGPLSPTMGQFMKQEVYNTMKPQPVMVPFASHPGLGSSTPPFAEPQRFTTLHTRLPVPQEPVTSSSRALSPAPADHSSKVSMSFPAPRVVAKEDMFQNPDSAAQAMDPLARVRLRAQQASLLSRAPSAPALLRQLDSREVTGPRSLQTQRLFCGPATPCSSSLSYASSAVSSRPL
jgi:hypothetical protein